MNGRQSPSYLQIDTHENYLHLYELQQLSLHSLGDSQSDEEYES